MSSRKVGVVGSLPCFNGSGNRCSSSRVGKLSITELMLLRVTKFVPQDILAENVVVSSLKNAILMGSGPRRDKSKFVAYKQ